MSRNLPDGCREGDLPGYWDEPCGRCEDEGESDDCPTCDGTGVVDSRVAAQEARDEAAIDAYVEARRG